MTRSILSRLLLLLLVPLSALLLVAAIGGYLMMRSVLYGSLDQQLRAQAEALATLTEFEDGQIVFEFQEHLTEGDLDERFVKAAYEAWLPDGTVAYRSDDLRGANLSQFGSTGPNPLFRDIVMPNGSPARAVQITFTPQLDGPGPAPLVTLMAAEETADILSLLSKLRVSLGGIFGVLLVVGFLVTVIAVKKGLSPLAEVSNQVDRIDAKTLGHRFSLNDVPNEIHPLCEKLNELLARLEASFQREKRFSDHAAHELRTPVSELRALAEVALTAPDTLSDDSRQAFADALDIARQLQNITEALYALARNDSTNGSLNPEPMDLSREIIRIWGIHAAKVDARGIEARLRLPDSLPSEGNSHAVASVLSNLISNCAEYTPPGGEIEISGGMTDGAVELRFSNTAPDLREEDLPHLFERFWRKDESRSSPTHCGLGLSLAQSLAERLGWSLLAGLNEGKLTMLLTCPRSPPPFGAGKRRFRHISGRS